MSLTSAEILRLKIELGFNGLSYMAEPWIGTSQIFTQIIAPYLDSSVTTTSSTAVTAATTPTPIALTLASATGFATGDRVYVDVEDRMESTVIQSLSGAVATVQLSAAHNGTYRFDRDSGESIVREYLGQIKRVKSDMAGAMGTGALKQVDEIQWYQSGNKTQFGILGDELMFWRDELAAAVGAPNMWRRRRSGGSSIAIY